MVLGSDKPYFVVNHTESKKKYYEEEFSECQIAWLKICLADVSFNTMATFELGPTVHTCNWHFPIWMYQVCETQTYFNNQGI